VTRKEKRETQPSWPIPRYYHAFVRKTREVISKI